MSLSPNEAFDPDALVYLRALQKRYPNVQSVLAEIANLRSILTLRKGTIHVLSDVHGEFKKLKHIINNASGSLRPLVEKVFGDRLDGDRKLLLLNLIYYPQQTYSHALAGSNDPELKRTVFTRAVLEMAEVLRAMARSYTLKVVDRRAEEPFQLVFRELLHGPELGRSEEYLEALLLPFLSAGAEVELLRGMAHLIRNLSVEELIVAGDLGDRGPRIDKVIGYLMHQPNTAITWGNHDFSWMGACLGQGACIATVMRISLRYRRLSQLEEGYGIPAAPLEKLARTIYGNDPAAQFQCKGEGLRDPQLMARMQKAMAIIQFKLEGQTMRRNPGWEMEHRMLLGRIDPAAKTLRLGDQLLPLLDAELPTVDWRDPYALSPEEQACLDRLQRSFLESPVLWEQMSYVKKHGRMFLRRDETVIFHGCVPVDASGEFLSFSLDGQPLRGRALFEGLDRVVQRAFQQRRPADLDLLWYLWTGPLSPSFGKDKMATFEMYFLADKQTHHEEKNPYFKLIHSKPFCEKILREFDIASADGLIVNGHVPVKLEKGESPLKDSGMAVTIDGAFSEAYGDKGYTLVLDAHRTYLAQHHHFESIEEAILDGADIVPSIQVVREFDRARTVGDTEKGDQLRREIGVLERLIRAYRENVIEESV